MWMQEIESEHEHAHVCTRACIHTHTQPKRIKTNNLFSCDSTNPKDGKGRQEGKEFKAILNYIVSSSLSYMRPLSKQYPKLPSMVDYLVPRK